MKAFEKHSQRLLGVPRDVHGSSLDRRGDGWQAVEHRYYTVFRDLLLIGGGMGGNH